MRDQRLADEAQPRRVQPVQRTKAARRIPPARRMRGEAVDFRRINGGTGGLVNRFHANPYAADMAAAAAKEYAEGYGADKLGVKLPKTDLRERWRVSSRNLVALRWRMWTGSRMPRCG